MTTWVAALATSVSVVAGLPAAAHAAPVPAAQAVEISQVAASVGQDTLAARATYFQGQGMTADLQKILRAMEAQSPADGAIWRKVITFWDEANTSLKINAVVPAGLPTSGHVFALLGFALAADGSMQPELVSRLQVAKAALDAYPTSRIVVSGGVAKNGWTEATRMRDWLLSNGIAASRIILENEATNTQTNASKSLELMYAAGDITSYTVISSASHIRRATVLYHGASLKVQKETGSATFIRPLANVAYLDNTTSEQPPSASENSLITSNVASLFGVSTIFNGYATTAPPQPGLTVTAAPAAAGGRMQVSATFTNGDLFDAEGTGFTLTAPSGYEVRPVAQPDPVVSPGATATARWEIVVPADRLPMSTVALKATTTWSEPGSPVSAVTAAATGLVTGPIAAPYLTASTTPVQFAQHGDVFAIAGGGRDAYVRYDEYGTIFRPDLLADGQAVSARVLEQTNTGPYARAGLVVRNSIADRTSTGYATLAVTPGRGCVFAWDSDGDGALDKVVESGGFTAPVHTRISRAGSVFTGSCSSDGANWVDVASATIGSAEGAVDVGLYYSAVNESSGLSGLARFQGLTVSGFTRRVDSADTVVSVGKPATALSSESGRDPGFAVDGDRTNNRYWASTMVSGPTWLQVDLGRDHTLSSINVRNYVQSPRSYQYGLAGSRDGKVWFPLGGKGWAAAATDAGDTFAVAATARYVRVTGLANTANTSFHLTEVTVRGVVSPEDTTPPVTTASATEGDPSVLTLAAVDDVGGSGVAVIEYRIDSGAFWSTYTSPVSIPRTSAPQTVQYRAVDVVGNVESVKEIVVGPRAAVPTTVVIVSAPTQVSTKEKARFEVRATAAKAFSGTFQLFDGATMVAESPLYEASGSSGVNPLHEARHVFTRDGSGMPTGRRMFTARFLAQTPATSSVSTASPVEVYFYDLPPSATFYTEVAWLTGSGISTGMSDGSFAPGAPVQRQAMAA
ncbi:hypothetical protein D1871_07075, partial [Nakamurella silvestris]